MNARPQPPFPGFGSPAPVPRRPKRNPASRSIAVWIAAALLALLLLSAVGLSVLLHNDRFHAYLLRTAQQKASAALGSDVQIQNYAIHWSGMSFGVDAYGVVVHGAAPYSDPPLLQADRLHVGITVISILRRSWLVDDLQLEHPVSHIIFDTSGHTNLPPTRSQESGALPPSSQAFTLGVRHLLLDHGEIYFNDRKNQLSANLRDLRLQAVFDVLAKRYTGELSYQDGQFQTNATTPVPHRLDMHFTATWNDFQLENAVLTSGASSLELAGNLHDYATPQVHLTYKALVNSGEVRGITRNPSLPAGIIQSSGTVDYSSQGDRPFLAGVKANGDLRSEALTVMNPSARIQLRNAGARFTLANGDATVSEMHAQVLGGAVTGLLTMRNLTGATRSHLSASARGISAADLQNLLQSMEKSAPPPRVVLHGSLNATADATWGTTMQDSIVRADATLQANAQTVRGNNSTPLQGIVHAQYAGSRGVLSLQNTSLRTPNSSLTLGGTVSKRAALNIRAESQNLHELEMIAEAFRPDVSEPVGIYGRASLVANVTGSIDNPNVTGQLTAEDLRVRGSAWKVFRSNFSAEPNQVRLERGELDSQKRGKITFQIVTALHRWSWTPSSPFQISLHANQINVAELTVLVGLRQTLDGTLSADIVASGTQLSPAGHGKLDLTSATIQGEPVRAVSVQFSGTGRQVDANWKVDLAAGVVNGNLTYEPSTQSYSAEVHAPGLTLDQLEAVKSRNLDLHGSVELNARGKGTTRDPQLQAVIAVPELRVHDQIVRGLKLQTNVANHAANFILDSELLNIHAGGRGKIELQGDYLADASFDTQEIPLAPLIAIYLPSQSGNLIGQTEVHGRLHGPLKDSKHMEGHLVVPRLALNYKNSIQLATEAPIRLDYSAGVLQLQRSVIRGTGTEMTVQATVPLDQKAPTSVVLRGVADLRLAQLVNPDIASGGELHFDIDSTGLRNDPNVQGEIRIVNATFAEAGAPLGLRDGNGVLTLTRDRLNVTQFHGKMGGGTVTASGGMVYRPQLQFDLAMAAQGVRFLYDQNVRSTLNSNLALTGTLEQALLSGQMNVDQVSFTSDFDVSDLMAQFSGETSPPPAQGFGQNLRLDVAVQTPAGLNLTSRTLSLAGTANLHVRGTAAQPVLLGRMNLTDGDLIFTGNRYRLQGGTIDFSNRSRTELVVDLSMSTTISQYDIQMHFWGPVEHLHTNYASDPSLPPSDIINLIAFGKTSESDAANPTPPGSLGAQSLLASQASSQITNRVEKLAGISQLSIDPVLGSSQQSPGARIAVQQRITSKIFVTFASDVTSTQREAIQLEYQANRKTSFQAIRDQNGGFSFQTTFRKQW